MSARSVATASAAWLLAGCGQPAGAPAEPADPPGPALLFAAGKGDLSAAERGQIFGATGLAVTPDGGGFVDGICGQPAGLNSYMSFQITPAATKEMAMGRKMKALAAAS